MTNLSATKGVPPADVLVYALWPIARAEAFFLSLLLRVSRLFFLERESFVFLTNFWLAFFVDVRAYGRGVIDKKFERVCGLLFFFWKMDRDGEKGNTVKKKGGYLVHRIIFRLVRLDFISRILFKKLVGND